MRAGAEMFLQACTEPEAQQIVLLDGPSVLGWDRWREIAAEHGLGLIEATLQAAVEAGAIAAQPVRPLAHVLMGALDEAAMLVARAEDPEQMRAEVGRTLDSLLAGLSAVAEPERRACPRFSGAAVTVGSSNSSWASAARLLLRVHAHVGELQGGRGVALLGRDLGRAPGGARPRTPVRSRSAPGPRRGSRRRSGLGAGEQHAELVAADPVGGAVLADRVACSAAPRRTSSSSPAGWPKVSL